ncbi:cytochrome c [Halioxenophilus sp. WMMB6]|uniref:c-type cytochrome n=1 Tax=Halioxenophilus sp. WMMB6 TaxID=3073815 RepID=UPI00295F4079|nr:cytochrome c [Halioxenophilus sp. WMMB6]
MKKLAISASLMLFAASGVMAGGDPAAGKAKAAVCASCHGMEGKAIAPMYPNLAGQNEPYLVGALKAYRDGQRQGGMSAVMSPMAKTLSDDDINNLAAYFASQK